MRLFVQAQLRLNLRRKRMTMAAMVQSRRQSTSGIEAMDLLVAILKFVAVVMVIYVAIISWEKYVEVEPAKRWPIYEPKGDK